MIKSNHIKSVIDQSNQTELSDKNDSNEHND